MSAESKILFSIIIPTYNRASLVIESIESILTQTYIHFEIIVVDDGSTDNTEAALRDIKDIRIKYFRKGHAGVSAARNYGIQKSSGSFICFLDSDDIMIENHLQILFNSIILDKKQNYIYRTKFKSWPADNFSETISFNSKKQNRIQFVLINPTAIHTYCFPRIIAKSIQFDERFHFFEDTSFIARGLFNYDLKQIDETTVIYRNHTSNSTLSIYNSKTYGKYLENNLQSIKALFNDHKNELTEFSALSLENKLIARKLLEHGHMAIANSKIKIGLHLLLRSIKVKFISKYTPSYLSLILKSLRQSVI